MNIQRQRENQNFQVNAVGVFDISAIAVVTIGGLVLLWYGPQGISLMIYFFATVLTIFGGVAIEKISASNQEMATQLNNHCHQWAVAAVNGLMGIACVGYLIFKAAPAEAVLPLGILGIAFCLYVASWATKLIRSHSFWARFRSVLMRVVLTTVICGIIWRWGFLITPVLAIPIVVIAWRHLRRDQEKFGWAWR